MQSFVIHSTKNKKKIKRNYLNNRNNKKLKLKIINPKTVSFLI